MTGERSAGVYALGVRIAVVVNASSRRGGGNVAQAARKALPNANILLSRTLDELDAFARELVSRPPELIVSAGGDGTAVATLNALRRAERKLRPTLDTSKRRALGPAMAVLKLGTGNGWARATGAPSLSGALGLLSELDRTGARAPVRRFDLVEVEGKVAHFTGTGWDAEIIDDFHEQKKTASLLPRARRDGLLGYLNGLLTITVPRNVKIPQAEVEIMNLGSEAMTVDAYGAPVGIHGAHAGEVLYRGPTSVCGIGTAPEWGFGFRAFPFAGLVEGRFNLRNYSGRAVEALARTPSLWRGVHPLVKMSSWLLNRARLTFSRKVPFQLGGDLLGHRDTIEYEIAPEYVHVVDWEALGRGVRIAPRHERPSDPLGRSLRAV